MLGKQIRESGDGIVAVLAPVSYFAGALLTVLFNFWGLHWEDATTLVAFAASVAFFWRQFTTSEYDSLPMLSTIIPRFSGTVERRLVAWKRSCLAICLVCTLIYLFDLPVDPGYLILGAGVSIGLAYFASVRIVYYEWRLPAVFIGMITLTVFATSRNVSPFFILGATVLSVIMPIALQEPFRRRGWTGLPATGASKCLDRIYSSPVSLKGRDRDLQA